ncbi:hypothetical protein VTO73DRAFT_10174 [Trametes versicolor]
MCLPRGPSPRLPDYRPRRAALVLGPPSQFHAHTLCTAHAHCLPAVRAAGRPLRDRRCTVSGHRDRTVPVSRSARPSPRRTQTSTEDRGSNGYRPPAAAVQAERIASVARPILARPGAAENQPRCGRRRRCGNEGTRRPNCDSREERTPQRR